MPLIIQRNDITLMKVDAIVNAANESLLGGGGVDGAIHKAAGPALLAECKTLGGCKTGSAKITKAGNLPCNYVIHAVGPKWRGGSFGEEQLLSSCYTTALKLAREKGCETVAFPLISSGIYGYPKEEALNVATKAIAAFLAENEMTVYLVIFDKTAYAISEALFADISAYIDDCYAEEHTNARSCWLDSAPLSAPLAAAPIEQDNKHQKAKGLFSRKERSANVPPPMIPAASAGTAEAETISLDQAVEMIDESFSEMLLRKIDEKGLTDVQCYKKANIDRKLFSKIRGNKSYKPSKPTVLAFAVALELSLEETQELLMKAGLALSRSYKFDIIVEYFIRRGNYNIFEINEALFAFDQSLLGFFTTH